MNPPLKVSKIDFGALRRIAVFRTLQLGDMLCAVPAMRALRRAAPHAKITLVGLPWVEQFVARFPHYIDDYLAFPGFPGLPETRPDVARLPRFLFEAQHRRFDLAIQLHDGGALSNPITGALGAHQHAGFYVPGAYCPHPALFMPWPEDQHEVARHLALLRFLGAKANDASLEFPLREADYEALAAIGPLPAAGRYVCIHPGARLAAQRWPARRFAQVADALAGQGWHVVVTGSAFERPIVDELIKHASAPLIDLGGRTTLGALAALMAGARMVLCNDTGVSHLAAALATPSVVLSSGCGPARWAPLRGVRQRVLQVDLGTRPDSAEAEPGGHPGIADADQVQAEALELCAPPTRERSAAR